MNLTSISRRRAGAGVAVGALTASTLLFAPAAQAATTSVLESQIGTTASTNGWYQTGGAVKITNAGLELPAGGQLLKGNADSTTSTLDDVDAAAVVATPSGAASFRAQLTDDTIAAGARATLRETATDVWQSDTAIGTTIEPNTNTSIAAIKSVVGDDAKIAAFGVTGTAAATVSSITFDDKTYLFGNNAPVAKDRSLSTKLNTPVSIPLSATDVDGNQLTYTVTGVVGGSVSGTGAAQTFTPTKNFRGAASVKYTVDDGRGGVATATVSIQVEKLKGKVEIYRINPSSKISVRRTVSLYATVKVDGKAAPQGTTVYGYAKGKKVITGKVNSSGKVKLTLPVKLPAGKSTLKVTQAGSSKLSGGSDSVVVRVRK